MSSQGTRGKAHEHSSDWVRNTRLYRQSQSIRQAIDAHKWCESERAGHDIGWEKAAVSWMIRYGRYRP